MASRKGERTLRRTKRDFPYFVEIEILRFGVVVAAVSYSASAKAGEAERQMIRDC